MVSQLIKHERIETTVQKAKELRRVADQVVTLGKQVRRRTLAVGHSAGLGSQVQAKSPSCAPPACAALTAGSNCSRHVLRRGRATLGTAFGYQPMLHLGPLYRRAT